MIRGIEDANIRIRELLATRRMENTDRATEIVVISQDVKALYPSLDWDEIVKLVGKLLEETDVSFKDIDYKQIGKFLAVHLTLEEIARNNLISVIPKRKKSGRGGPKPGMAYLDSDVDKDGNEKWDWSGKRKTPSEIQQKKMVARMMEIVVRAILSNHLYQFDGKVFKQQKGGPIGLEVTGVLARLVMLWWDRAFKDKLRRLEIDLLMYLRYVRQL